MKTWFVDIDGTIVEHRSNKEIGEGTHEKLLPGSKEFLQEARQRGDQIILTTARLTIHSEHTERMLDDFGIPYDEIVYNLSPYERIVVNDIKPIGEHRDYEMYTAFAINVERNRGLDEYRRWKPRFTWSYKRQYGSNID